MDNVIVKGDFAKKFAEGANISPNKAAEEVNIFLGLIQSELEAGNAVNFTGFGKFDVAERAERMGRNPGNGETIKIAATKVPRFKAGAGLKSAIKGGN